MTTCPHCARPLSSKGFRHLCPQDPARRAAIVEALTDPDRPGTARTTNQYRAISALYGTPDIGTLLNHFGNWRSVTDYFGLAPSSSKCPHCGRTVFDPAHPAARHAHPDKRAAILAAMTDPDRPGHAVGPTAYDARARITGAPSFDSLRNVFNGWPAVCAFFGLSYRAQRSQNREAAAMAEVAAAVDEDRELQREWAGRGLTVCSVRALPDGRVACMLR